jgi:hypothetical protein
VEGLNRDSAYVYCSFNDAVTTLADISEHFKNQSQLNLCNYHGGTEET